MPTRDALLQEICSAFKNSSKPNQDKIVRGESLEAKMIKQILAHKTWTEVDPKLLSNYDQRADLSAMIAFLSSDGFRYGARGARGQVYLSSIALLLLRNTRGQPTIKS